VGRVKLLLPRSELSEFTAGLRDATGGRGEIREMG